MKLEFSREWLGHERSMPGACHLASSPVLRWYLILTKPSAEEVAKANLERQGYRVYFPRMVQRKSCHGVWREKISALFPRYLFIQVDVGSQALGPVRSTLGVVGPVQFGSEYSVVPHQVVEGLMRRANPLSGLHEIKRPLLTSGAVVEVIAGAFAGLEGVFEREIGEDRVVVLFTLLGRESAVNLTTDSIIPRLA